MAEDIVVLREILQRELETINAYEKMLERVSDPSLKHIIEHVTDEEREHVAEMYQLIMERDPKQLERSRRGTEQLRGMNLVAGSHPGAAATDATLVSPARATPADNVTATAAAAAGLSAPLLVPESDDPFPSPPPIFPDGAWSVGGLKRSKLPGPGAPGALH